MSDATYPAWHRIPQEAQVCAELNGGECPHDDEFMASLPWPEPQTAD